MRDNVTLDNIIDNDEFPLLCNPRLEELLTSPEEHFSKSDIEDVISKYELLAVLLANAFYIVPTIYHDYIKDGEEYRDYNLLSYNSVNEDLCLTLAFTTTENYLDWYSNFQNKENVGCSIFTYRELVGLISTIEQIDGVILNHGYENMMVITPEVIDDIKKLLHENEFILENAKENVLRLDALEYEYKFMLEDLRKYFQQHKEVKKAYLVKMLFEDEEYLMLIIDTIRNYYDIQIDVSDIMESYVDNEIISINFYGLVRTRELVKNDTPFYERNKYKSDFNKAQRK